MIFNAFEVRLPFLPLSSLRRIGTEAHLGPRLPHTDRRSTLLRLRSRPPRLPLRSRDPLSSPERISTSFSTGRLLLPQSRLRRSVHLPSPQNSTKLSLTSTRLPTVVHALVLLYQLISLNVAVNSYDYALLTLLVSNQFAEIKGCEYPHPLQLYQARLTNPCFHPPAVFKKFEKENLFQIACAFVLSFSLLLLVESFDRPLITLKLLYLWVLVL